MNSIYYELAIFEQQINYFILESKYNEIVLNESIGDKIKNAKKWIKERVGDLVKLVQKVLKKIRYFFFEYLPGKLKDLKDKILKKNKQKETDKNKVFETIDINNLLKNFENIRRNAIIKFSYVDFPCKDDFEKYKNECNQFLSLNFNDKFKDEIEFINNIDKTNIKISYGQILSLYENSGLADLDFPTKEGQSQEKVQKKLEAELYRVAKELEDDNRSTDSDYIEIFSLYSKQISKSISLYGNALELYNRYTSKIYWYYNTYLNSNDRKIAKNEHDAEYKKVSQDQVKEWAGKLKKGDYKKAADDMGSLVYLGVFDQIDEMMKIAKEKGCLQEYKSIDKKFDISDDKNKYLSRNYLTMQVFGFKQNPCEKRYNHIKTIYKMQHQN